MTPKAASRTGVKELHEEAEKPTKLAQATQPLVHIRYYPEVVAQLLRKRVGQPRNA